MFGYNLAGDYGNDMSAEYAITPAIDASQYSHVNLSFYRWLGVESSTWDHAKVEWSTDGSSWNLLWENGATMSESAWTFQNLAS